MVKIPKLEVNKGKNSNQPISVRKCESYLYFIFIVEPITLVVREKGTQTSIVL